MGQLNSTFSQNDIEVLIDAMGDWESVGNHEYHVMQMVKSHPMPDHDDESYEFIKKIKDHFRKREKEIKAERVIRQEKAILVKAKLVLLRQEGGINKLIEVAVSEDHDDSRPPVEAGPSPSKSDQNRLELAEYYIKDLGVWDMYQKFLADRGVEDSPKSEECSDEESDDDGWFHTEDSDD